MKCVKKVFFGFVEYVLGGIVGFRLLYIMLNMSFCKEFFCQKEIVFFIISLVLVILAIIRVIIQIFERQNAITNLNIWVTFFLACFLVGSYFQLDESLDKFANVILSAATGIISGLVISLLQNFKNFEKQNIEDEITQINFRYSIHHEMAKHIANTKKNKSLSEKQRMKRYKKTIKIALNKYQKIIESISKEKYEEYFYQAGLVNPDYERFLKIPKDLEREQNLDRVFASIDNLDKILEKAEKEQLVRDEQQLTELKKHIEGIILV